MTQSADYTALFSEHRPHLLGLAYRITGSLGDAEDLVQDAFVRALERPPADKERSWAPWLRTVTARLAIDGLRRRHHAGYTGPFLPTPLDVNQMASLLADPRGDEQRFEHLESLSFGFMLALETLSAPARAVLVLRDALGYTGPETAEILEMTDENVRATLVRARRTMEALHQEGIVPTPLQHEAAVTLLTRFMHAAASGDVDAIVACLTDDVALVADGGGRYASPLRPLHGASAVQRFIVGVGSKGHGYAVALAEINGFPALLITAGGSKVKTAPPFTMLRIELDPASQRISAIHLVSAPDKVRHLSFPSLPVTP